MHKEKEFSIKHHRRTFKSEHITLNNLGFIHCIFDECVMIVVDDPTDTIYMDSCTLKNCSFVGDGWNYELVEAMEEASKNGTTLNWSGPIGNKKITKH